MSDDGAAPPPRAAALPASTGADDTQGRWLCAAAALEERGRAVVWELLQWGQRTRAFALRHEGRVVAYLNRCAHVPTEMDWNEGEFLDMDRRFILCSIHGAAYEPADGRCVGGPCGRGRLVAIRVEERGGEVYWYPSRDSRPVPPAAGDPAPPGAVRSDTP